MKIAMISLTAPPPGPGEGACTQAVHVTELARELGRQGHDVTVYTRGTGAPAPIGDGARVEPVPAGPDRHLTEAEVLPHLAAFARGLGDRLAREKPDVAHAHGWTSGLAALSARDGVRHVPLVQSYRRPVTPRTTGRAEAGRARLERALGRSAEAVAAGCEQEREDLVGMGVPRPRIAVIPAGVDTGAFTEHGPSYPRGDRPRLLALCGPAGAGPAVRALPGIPGAELVVAGGPDVTDMESDVVAGELLREARRLGVDDRLIRLGRVSRTNVPRLLRSADLVLSLAMSEPYGLVAVEAMACGVPVVASRAGGHLDTVIDGVTGLLTDPARPAELARDVRALLADPTRLAALGVAGADRARSRHAWSRVAAETAAVYEWLQR